MALGFETLLVFFLLIPTQNCSIKIWKIFLGAKGGRLLIICVCFTKLFPFAFVMCQRTFSPWYSSLLGCLQAVSRLFYCFRRWSIPLLLTCLSMSLASRRITGLSWAHGKVWLLILYSQSAIQVPWSQSLFWNISVKCANGQLFWARWKKNQSFIWTIILALSRCLSFIYFW